MKNDFSGVGLTACHYENLWFAREKVFRNSSGYGFNVSFVNCMSVFVKSVLQASLSFTHILQITTFTFNDVDHFCSVTSNV